MEQKFLNDMMNLIKMANLAGVSPFQVLGVLDTAKHAILLQLVKPIEPEIIPIARLPKINNG